MQAWSFSFSPKTVVASSEKQSIRDAREHLFAKYLRWTTGMTGATQTGRPHPSHVVACMARPRYSALVLLLGTANESRVEYQSSRLLTTVFGSRNSAIKFNHEVKPPYFGVLPCAGQEASHIDEHDVRKSALAGPCLGLDGAEERLLCAQDLDCRSRNILPGW